MGKTPLSLSLFLWAETCAIHTFCSECVLNLDVMPGNKNKTFFEVCIAAVGRPVNFSRYNLQQIFLTLAIKKVIATVNPAYSVLYDIAATFTTDRNTLLRFLVGPLPFS